VFILWKCVSVADEVWHSCCRSVFSVVTSGTHTAEVCFLWLKFCVHGMELCFLEFVKFGVHAVEVCFLQLKFGVHIVEVCFL